MDKSHNIMKGILTKITFIYCAPHNQGGGAQGVRAPQQIFLNR